MMAINPLAITHGIVKTGLGRLPIQVLLVVSNVSSQPSNVRIITLDVGSSEIKF